MGFGFDDALSYGAAIPTGGASLFLGDMFGSSDSPRIDSMIPPEVAGLARSVMGKAQGYLDKGFGPMPELRTLGFNPYETATIQKLKDAFSSTPALTARGASYVEDVLGGKFLNPDNPILSRYADAVSSGASRFLAKNADELASNFALAGGASSSALANAKMRAAVDSSQRVGEILSSMYANAYESERQRQQAALPLVEYFSNEPVQRLLQALQLGGTERSLAQTQQKDEYTNFVNRRENEILPLRLALSALQGIPLEKPTYGPSEMEQNLSLLFQGMNALGGMGKGIASMGAA